MRWAILKTYLQDFARDARGTVAVETAVILPVLLWSYMAVLVFFDMFRSRAATEKAAYTVSDMLSRETAAIDTEYMQSAHRLFQLLARSDGSTALRVTVISFSASQQTFVFEWSKVQGLITAYDEQSVTGIYNKLPTMVDGETLILVETRSQFNPAINVGLTDLDFETFIFTRPRFAPQLVWSS